MPLLTRCSCCSKEDYDKARVLLNDAARSGSYLYPIKASSRACYRAQPRGR
jgi:hypothetical protein